MRSLICILCLIPAVVGAQAPVFQSSSPACTQLGMPANGLQVSNCILSLSAADGSNPGALTAGTQTIGGAKTFTSTISASNLSGTNTGDVTLGASTNGLSLTGQTLQLAAAGAAQAGAVTTGTQTFGGAKTFASTISASNLSGTNTGDVTIGTANGLSLSGQALSLAAAATGQAGAVSTGAQSFDGAKTFNSTIAASNFSGSSSGTNTGDVTIGTANGLSLSGQALSLAAAATGQAGAVSTGAQSFDGAKTFNSTISASNFSGSSSGTNTGDVTLAAVGASPSANGASLSGQVLTLQPADGTHPGLITSGTQTLGGTKTFSSSISASNLSGTNTGDVTISTANGLSLSGQALSMSLADASTTGTMSSSAQTFGGNKTFNGSVQAGAGSANSLTIAGAAAASSPTITASGSDSAIGIPLVPKGAANLSLPANDWLAFDGTNTGTPGYGIRENSASTRLEFETAGVLAGYIDSGQNTTLNNALNINGKLTITGSAANSVVFANNSVPLTLRGSSGNAGTNNGVVIDNNTTLTGTTRIISFQNNTVEKAFIDNAGSLTLASGNVLAGGTSAMTLTPNVANAGTNIALTVNNATSLTGTTELLELQNNGTRKFSVDNAGVIKFADGTTQSTAGTSLTVGSPANGLAISSGQITLAAATGSVPGAVSIGTQHFAGDKVFESPIHFGASGPFNMDYDSGAANQGGIRFNNSNTGRVAEFLQPTNDLFYLKFNNAAGGGGVMFVLVGLPTCASGFEGLVLTDNTSGVNTGHKTRLCLCISQGANNYAWQNTVSATVGTSTTCSD